MSTSTHLPLCVYCGTARPADQTRCPHCGRPWIDVRIGGAAEEGERSRVPAMVGATAAVGVDDQATEAPPDASTTVPAATVIDDHAADDPGEPASPPPETATDSGDVPPPFGSTDDSSGDSSQRFVWLIPALIAAAAVVVVALFGFGLLDNPEPVPTAAPTTVPAPTTTAPTTTSQAPTTTAVPSTTTTTTIPAPAAIAPVGDAISMSSLTIRTAGIGPILLGGPAPDAIGRLVASLGRPEEIGVAGEELGLCAGEEGRFVRWAGLTAVISGTLEDGTFAGYRYVEPAVPTMHLDFSTPSGLRVGDSVASLNDVYSSYQVDYVTDGGVSVFRLSDADGLLLWGPLSSVEPTGRVEGIHSPDACTS